MPRDGNCGQEQADADVQGVLERQLPENCVEYFLFLVDEEHNARKQVLNLEGLQRAAHKLGQTLTKDYIWQRDGFELKLKTENGLPYLHGVTDYGDAVEDEWLIVYMLRELTKSHPALWVRAVDADGEFLLIEAANVLPEWLSPEMDQNRVWLHDGKLFIIPLEDDGMHGTQNQSLSLSQAVDSLQSRPGRLVHSPLIQTEALYRLGKYPGQIADSAHNSLATIPRKLAHIVHSLPKSVSPAVEAFYLRDPLSLKPVLSTSAVLAFPPEDLVTTSVRFSRVLFAQLKSQRFEPPPRWHRVLKEASSTDCADVDKKMARLESGMKLTCAFEMLAASANEKLETENKRRIVQEIANLLEKTAKLGAAALPTDEEMGSWQDCDRDDDETWMDIDYRDFERELDGKPASGKKAGFGNVQTQADLRKIVSRFESFLNDESAGLEGAELDEADEDPSDDEDEEDSEFEDKVVSFDEQAFSRMMREMMGMPTADLQSAIDSQAAGHTTTAEAETSALDEESAQLQELAHQMEVELKHHGALTCDGPSEKQAAVEDLTLETRGEDSHDEVDIDFNLARNILESFKSQAGMAGPTGNLLGMMGFRLPRDEDEADDKSSQRSA
ncbi:SGT1 protein [Hirsutella rhossiliensis]|uniref:SGT1 protein n=1 Tax=Hirsutella rhossiliensis TaxID=111463 RepID=A0A9P8MRN1_9HYPO|nr:SGT1 protein [Hirsutella rhossiliensis]KAH0957972.1 SGT1 protein [Hirsutella rhossiliensis]